MKFERFQRIREEAEDIKDKVEDFHERREALKDQRILEHLQQVRGVWKNGPVRITVEPAFFGSPGIQMRQLAKFEDFEKVHGELAGVLWQKAYTRPSPLIVGRIDIGTLKSPEIEKAEPYMQEGKSVIFAGAELLKDVEGALRDLARAIKNEEKPVCDIDYVIGVSRLGSIAGHLGFDTYPLDERFAHEHQSHQLAEEANIRSGMDAAKAKEKAYRRAATFAVMSKKKLLELYG